MYTLIYPKLQLGRVRWKQHFKLVEDPSLIDHAIQRRVYKMMTDVEWFMIHMVHCKICMCNEGVF
jgi:hypothetical protein